jgi:hypothetical protein
MTKTSAVVKEINGQEVIASRMTDGIEERFRQIWSWQRVVMFRSPSFTKQ